MTGRIERVGSRAAGGAMARFVAAACALALAYAMCTPVPALAYFSKPGVSVSFGMSSLSMTTGSSNSVSMNVSPMNESQLPGCGMSICPQECDGLTNPETGAVGGCLNGEGWCTCAGTSYYTAYTQLSVSSSNPTVARATVSGSTLSVTAYAAGSTTLTVTASLSKHVDSSASLTVNVSDPSSGGSGSGSGGSGGSGSGSDTSGGSGGGSGSGSGSGEVSVSAVGTSATAAAAAAAAAEGAPQEVVEMEAADGTKVIVAEAAGAAAAAEELAKIAGTEGTCTFWSGGTLDSPSISWTFKGIDLDPEADLAFDPAVSVSKKGAGAVAKLLRDVDDAIVIDFAHAGALPAPAWVYVRASSVFADGAKLGLYVFDEEAQRFTLAQKDVEVESGYAVFELDHCSTWALSQTDLAALDLASEEEAAAEEGDFDATTVDVHAQDAAPYLVGAIVVIAAITAVALVVVLRRRKRKAADEEAAKAVPAAGEGILAAEGADAEGADATAHEGEVQREGDAESMGDVQSERDGL